MPRNSGSKTATRSPRHRPGNDRQTGTAELRVQNRDEVASTLRDMEKRGLVERAGTVRTSPYRLAKKARQAYFDMDYEEVGTAADVEEVASKAVEAYLKQGLFVATASPKIKKGRDRTDLMAYDYTREAPILVEVESASEVQNHPEHVMYNMTKCAKLGFAECHVWSKSPKIREIRERLDEEQKKHVSVIVIPS